MNQSDKVIIDRDLFERLLGHVPASDFRVQMDALNNALQNAIKYALVKPETIQRARCWGGTVNPLDWKPHDETARLELENLPWTLGGKQKS